MSEFTLQILKDLIMINSVNPSLVPGSPGEKEIADAIAGILRKIGMDVEIEEVVAGRPNVIGMMEGKSKGRSLMLCGHTDTVGVAGMTAPFDPMQKDGRIYGRGSQDMKGGLAAMIGAAHAIANQSFKSGRLILAMVTDEEYASVGAEQLVKKWKADAGVVTEPTDMKIAIAHKGFAWVEVSVFGRAAHGSRPEEGRDAITRMGRFLTKLESLDREIQSRQKHPILGTGSLHASLIQGGRELSTYPDRCSLQFERRILTTEKMEIALEEANRIIAELKEEDPEFEASAAYLFGRPAYEIPGGNSLPDTLLGILEQAEQKTEKTGMTYWTDAAILGEAGIPSVIFGPSGAGLHSIEEYVVADDVLACRDALTSLIQTFC